MCTRAKRCAPRDAPGTPRGLTAHCHATQLHGADDNIGKSRRILASMAKRALQNKVMLGAVIGILLMCIFLIIVVKTRNKH